MSINIKIKKDFPSFALNVQFQSAANRVGILGASGCGKSMTLKCIAGIETPQEGTVQLDHSLLFDSAQKINRRPQDRNIGYLFQNYALFPTMTVAQNIASGLKCPKPQKQARIQEMIEKFHLSGLASRYPSQLSGGQQQRVALARIIASQPDAILLDEPFSALDLFLRDKLQRELMETLKDYSGTVILVSHSRDEIYRFSDEILVLDQGADVAYGKTKEIFASPVYQEVAKLTGCKNFSEIRHIGPCAIEAVDWGISLRLSHPAPQQATCIGYRAHDFVPVWGERPRNALPVQVAGQADLPFETNYYLLPQNPQASAEQICWFVQRVQMPEIQKKGMPDYLEFQEEKIMFLQKKHEG